MGQSFSTLGVLDRFVSKGVIESELRDSLKEEWQQWDIDTVLEAFPKFRQQKFLDAKVGWLEVFEVLHGTAISRDVLQKREARKVWHPACFGFEMEKEEGEKEDEGEQEQMAPEVAEALEEALQGDLDLVQLDEDAKSTKSRRSRQKSKSDSKSEGEMQPSLQDLLNSEQPQYDPELISPMFFGYTDKRTLDVEQDMLVTLLDDEAFKAKNELRDLKEREQEINRKISGLRGKLANVERDRKAKLQAREKSKEKRMRERETAEANLNEDEFEDFLKDWESREETIRLAEKEEDEAMDRRILEQSGDVLQDIARLQQELFTLGQEKGAFESAPAGEERCQKCEERLLRANKDLDSKRGKLAEAEADYRKLTEQMEQEQADNKKKKIRSMLLAIETEVKQMAEAVTRAEDEVKTWQRLLQQAEELRTAEAPIIPLYEVLKMDLTPDSALEGLGASGSTSGKQPETATEEVKVEQPPPQSSQSKRKKKKGKGEAEPEVAPPPEPAVAPMFGVSLRELMMSLIVLCNGSIEQKLHGLFQVFDWRQDGKLTVDQLRAALVTLYRTMEKTSGLEQSQWASIDALESFVVRSIRSIIGNDSVADSDLNTRLHFLYAAHALPGATPQYRDEISRLLQAPTPGTPTATKFLFVEWSKRTISYSKDLSVLFDVTWVFEHMSDYQRKALTPLQQYQMGMIDLEMLSVMLMRERMKPWPERDHAHKRAIHRLALARGADDPTKPDYSQFTVDKKAVDKTAIARLQYGQYFHHAELTREKQWKAAVEIQRTFRGWRTRVINRLNAMKYELEKARERAIRKAWRQTRQEITTVDKALKGKEKLKWDAKIRMRQIKLRSKGFKLNRSGVLDLMIEERAEKLIDQINLKYDEKQRKREKRLARVRLGRVEAVEGDVFGDGRREVAEEEQGTTGRSGVTEEEEEDGFQGSSARSGEASEVSRGSAAGQEEEGASQAGSGINEEGISGEESGTERKSEAELEEQKEFAIDAFVGEEKDGEAAVMEARTKEILEKIDSEYHADGKRKKSIEGEVTLEAMFEKQRRAMGPLHVGKQRRASQDHRTTKPAASYDERNQRTLTLLRYGKNRAGYAHEAEYEETLSVETASLSSLSDPEDWFEKDGLSEYSGSDLSDDEIERLLEAEKQEDQLVDREYAAKVFNEVIPEDDNDLMEFSDSDEDINQVEDMLNAAEKEERRVWRTMQKKLAQPFSSGEDHRFIMYSDDQRAASLQHGALPVSGAWWGMETGVRQYSSLGILGRARLRAAITRRLQAKTFRKKSSRRRNSGKNVAEDGEAGDKEGNEKSIIELHEGDTNVLADVVEDLAQEEADNLAFAIARERRLAESAVVVTRDDLLSYDVAESFAQQWIPMAKDRGGGMASGVLEMGAQWRMRARQEREPKPDSAFDGRKLGEVAWWLGPIAGSLGGGVRLGIPSLGFVGSGRRVPAEARFWRKEESRLPLLEGGLKGRDMFPPIQGSAEASGVHATTKAGMGPNGTSIRAAIADKELQKKENSKKRLKQQEEEKMWEQKEKEVKEYFDVKQEDIIPPFTFPALPDVPIPYHHARSIGLAVGENSQTAAARHYLSHAAPPLHIFRRRLLALSPGLSPRIVDNILAEHPSKRLLMAYVGSFPSREHLMRDLEEHYGIPPWHTPLLASRLISMRRTDFETGIVSRAVAALQWRHEAFLSIASNQELAAAVSQRLKAEGTDSLGIEPLGDDEDVSVELKKRRLRSRRKQKQAQQGAQEGNEELAVYDSEYPGGDEVLLDGMDRHILPRGLVLAIEQAETTFRKKDDADDEKFTTAREAAAIALMQARKKFEDARAELMNVERRVEAMEREITFTCAARENRFEGGPAAASLAYGAATVSPGDGLDPGLSLPMGAPSEGKNEAFPTAKPVKQAEEKIAEEEPEADKAETKSKTKDKGKKKEEKADAKAKKPEKTIAPGQKEAEALKKGENADDDIEAKRMEKAAIRAGLLEALGQKEDHKPTAIVPLCVLPPTLAIPSRFIHLLAEINSSNVPSHYQQPLLMSSFYLFLHKLSDVPPVKVVSGKIPTPGMARGWFGFTRHGSSAQEDVARALGLKGDVGFVRDAVTMLVAMSTEGDLDSLGGHPSDNMRSLVQTLRRQVEARIVAETMRLQAEKERKAREAEARKKKFRRKKQPSEEISGEDLQRRDKSMYSNSSNLPLVPRPGSLVTSAQREDWMGRYYSALALEETSPAQVLFKYQLLSDVMDDFITTATRHAKGIIDTMYLPTSQQYLQPIMRRYSAHHSRVPPQPFSVSGVASSIGTTCNVKETWKANNIYFSLAIDYRGLYNGSDEHVMKAAGAALRAGIAYSQLRIKGLATPLTTVIDYRGFRMIASAGIPLDLDEDPGWNVAGATNAIANLSTGEESAGDILKAALGQNKKKQKRRLSIFQGEDKSSGLREQELGIELRDKINKAVVVGALEGGESIQSVDEGALKLMSRAAKLLNLSPHQVRPSRDKGLVTLPCAADIQVFRGEDGRYYLRHLERAFPPEDPYSTPHLVPGERGHSIFWRFLRPEFLSVYPRPLSPDAFSGFVAGTPQQREHDTLVSAATHVMLHSVMGKFAESLTCLGLEGDYILAPAKGTQHATATQSSQVRIYAANAGAEAREGMDEPGSLKDLVSDWEAHAEAAKAGGNEDKKREQQVAKRALALRNAAKQALLQGNSLAGPSYQPQRGLLHDDAEDVKLWMAGKQPFPEDLGRWEHGIHRERAAVVPRNRRGSMTAAEALQSMRQADGPGVGQAIRFRKRKDGKGTKVEVISTKAEPPKPRTEDDFVPSIQPAVLQQLMGVDWTHELHARGINMRHLGLFRSYFWFRLLPRARPIMGSARLVFETGGEDEEPEDVLNAKAIAALGLEEVMKREELRRQGKLDDEEQQDDDEEEGEEKEGEENTQIEGQAGGEGSEQPKPKKKKKKKDASSPRSPVGALVDEAEKRMNRDADKEKVVGEEDDSGEKIPRRGDLAYDPSIDVPRGGVVVIENQKYKIVKEGLYEHGPDALTLDRPYEGNSAVGVEVWTGKVKSRRNSPEIRAVLLGEMVARAIKQLLRRYLRVAHARSRSVTSASTLAASCVAHILNCLSGSHAASAQFWDTEVRPQILHHFGPRALSAAEQLNLRISVLPVLPYVVLRLMAMTNISLKGSDTAAATPSATKRDVRRANLAVAEAILRANASGMLQVLPTTKPGLVASVTMGMGAPLSITGGGGSLGETGMMTMHSRATVSRSQLWDSTPVAEQEGSIMDSTFLSGGRTMHLTYSPRANTALNSSAGVEDVAVPSAYRAADIIAEERIRQAAETYNARRERSGGAANEASSLTKALGGGQHGGGKLRKSQAGEALPEEGWLFQQPGASGSSATMTGILPPGTWPTSNATTLDAFLTAPDGFIFTSDDAMGAIDQPRVKHNMFLYDFAKAQILSCHARLTKVQTYEAVVLRDRPLGYWPLTDLRGTKEARNRSTSAMLSMPLNYMGPVKLQYPCPVKGVSLRYDTSTAMATSRTIEGSAALPADRAHLVLPPHPTSGFSVEVWACLTGDHGRIRTVAHCGRYALGVSRSGEWAFSVFVGGKYDGGAMLDVCIIGPVAEPHKWYHVCGTFDGTIMRLFVNSKLVASTEVYAVAEENREKEKQEREKLWQEIIEEEKSQLETANEQGKAQAEDYLLTPEGSDELRREIKKLLEESRFKARLADAAALRKKREKEKKKEEKKKLKQIKRAKEFNLPLNEELGDLEREKEEKKRKKKEGYKEELPFDEKLAKTKGTTALTESESRNLVRERIIERFCAQVRQRVILDFQNRREQLLMIERNKVTNAEEDSQHTLRIGSGPVTKRFRKGTQFWSGAVAHASVYQYPLSSHSIFAHFQRGTKSYEHQTEHYASKAITHYHAALKRNPNDHVMLSAYTTLLCDSLTHTDKLFDVQSSEVALFITRIRDAVRLFQKEYNIAGLALLLKHLPSNPVLADLVVMIYEVLCSLEPVLKEVVDADYSFGDWVLGGRAEGTGTNLRELARPQPSRGGGYGIDDADSVSEGVSMIGGKRVEWSGRGQGFAAPFASTEGGEFKEGRAEADGTSIDHGDVSGVGTGRGIGTEYDLGGTTRFTKYRRERHVMEIVKDLPQRFGLGRLEAPRKHVEVAARIYITAASRFPQAYGGSHMAWLKRLEDPRAVVFMMQRVERGDDPRTMDLSQLPGLNERDLKVLLEFNKEVRRLSLANMVNFKGDVLAAVREHLEGLREVDLTGLRFAVNDKEVMAFSERYPQMLSLRVAKCLDVSDAGLMPFARACEVLTSIDLSGCWRITDETVKALAEKAWDLADLRLNDLPEITDAGLLALANSKCAKNLERLELRHCFSITDRGLEALFKVAPRLKHVDVSQCQHVTDTPLIQLVHVAHDLEHLCIAELSGITGRCLQYASYVDDRPATRDKMFHKLEVLDMHGCSNARDDALDTVAAKAKQLLTLDISDCPLLTDRTLFIAAGVPPQFLFADEASAGKTVARITSDEEVKRLAETTFPAVEQDLDVPGKAKYAEDLAAEAAFKANPSLAAAVTAAARLGRTSHLSTIPDEEARQRRREEALKRRMADQKTEEVEDTGPVRKVQVSAEQSAAVTAMFEDFELSDSSEEEEEEDTAAGSMEDMKASSPRPVTPGTKSVASNTSGRPVSQMTSRSKKSKKGGDKAPQLVFDGSAVTASLFAKRRTGVPCIWVDPPLVSEPQKRIPEGTVTLHGIGPRKSTKHAEGVWEPAFPRLQSLNLSHLDNCTDNGIAVLIPRCPKLENLNLSGTVHLTKRCLRKIIVSANSITALSLAHQRGVDDSLLHLISMSLFLTSLNVSHCPRVTDRGLQSIAMSCSDLEHLNVAWCRNVTTEGIRSVMRFCSKLHTLNVQHCRQVLPQLLKGETHHRKEVQLLQTPPGEEETSTMAAKK